MKRQSLVCSALPLWNILTLLSSQSIVDRQVFVISRSQSKISGIEGWHFISSAVYAGVDEGAGKTLTSTWSQNLGLVPAKKVMLHPDARFANVENKVNALGIFRLQKLFLSWQNNRL